MVPPTIDYPLLFRIWLFVWTKTKIWRSVLLEASLFLLGAAIDNNIDSVVVLVAMLKLHLIDIAPTLLHRFTYKAQSMTILARRVSSFSMSLV